MKIKYWWVYILALKDVTANIAKNLVNAKYKCFTVDPASSAVFMFFSVFCMKANSFQCLGALNSLTVLVYFQTLNTLLLL